MGMPEVNVRLSVCTMSSQYLLGRNNQRQMCLFAGVITFLLFLFLISIGTSWMFDVLVWELNFKRTKNAIYHGLCLFVVFKYFLLQWSPHV